MATKELNTLAPKKWEVNLSGARPALDTTDGVSRGDFVIDTSNGRVWRADDVTDDAPKYSTEALNTVRVSPRGRLQTIPELVAYLDALELAGQTDGVRVLFDCWHYDLADTV